MKVKKSDMISYCGLFCKECFIRTERIADLSVELKNTLDKVDFARHAKGLCRMIKEMEPLRFYPQFRKVLSAL